MVAMINSDLFNTNLLSLNPMQREIADEINQYYNTADKNFISSKSELIVSKNYLELLMVHSENQETNFVVILFESFIEFSCGGFVFQFKYDENQINAYILSLFKGEYEIYHTLVGNFIIKEQFRWLNENLKSRTRRSIFYFLFLPLREKYGKTKTLVFKSFV